MDKWTGSATPGEAFMVSLSKVLDRVASLEQGRGLRLVGQDLKTRDRAKGREWFQIGRIWSQSAAVELIEKAIDDALGAGEGRKLLKAMGAEYRWYGARVTKELAKNVVKQAQKIEALRSKLFAGEPVRFVQRPERMEDARATIHDAFVRPLQTNAVDPDLVLELPRVTITLILGGATRNITEEARAKYSSEKERFDYIVREIEDAVKDPRDNAEVNLRRFHLMTTFINQRTVAHARAWANETLGGEAAHGTGGGGQTSVVINRDDGEETGEIRFNLNIISKKDPARYFMKNDEIYPNELASGSYYYLQQSLEVSSKALGEGDRSGVIVQPAQFIAKFKFEETER
jgi:hypothetical protein